MVDISKIKNITVIGAGVMGYGIAQVALMAGFKVTLVDIKENILNNGLAKIEGGLKKAQIKGKLEEGASISNIMSRCRKSIDLSSAVKESDFVFEAVVEKLDIKKQICNLVMKNSPAHCIFASNTSTFRITDIAADSNRPENVIGMHFFLPVVLQCCVEVMKGEKTSDRVLDIGVEIGKRLPCLKGKRLSVRMEKESPGFIANRLLMPPIIYLSWIFDQAFDKGIPWEQIDADAEARKLIPMGPCELTDYLGVDTSYNVLKSYEKIFSPDFAPGKVLTKLVSEGNLGRKTGQGFYDWTAGKPEIRLDKKAGILNPEMSMAIMLNEGCKLLEENIVSGYKIIDDVMLTGTSMPGPFGPGKRNYIKWSKMLDEFVEISEKTYLRPCALMRSGGFINMRK
ncbi:MAG: 3-hydroxyacyl-CoA dehydrogenase family protein [Candidatus Lokiarchaeota archaeon]|nr:3-hydroxyacyl-CoA dehydrogenase family protein [Candidatus Lokiarchaeota archaeon]